MTTYLEYFLSDFDGDGDDAYFPTFQDAMMEAIRRHRHLTLGDQSLHFDTRERGVPIDFLDHESALVKTKRRWAVVVGSKGYYRQVATITYDRESVVQEANTRKGE